MPTKEDSDTSMPGPDHESSKQGNDRPVSYLSRACFVLSGLTLVSSLSLVVFIHWNPSNPSKQLLNAYVRQVNGEKASALSESMILKYHAMALNKVSSENIRALVKNFSSSPHFGGTKVNLNQALDLKARLKKYGWDRVEIKSYKGLMSFSKKPGRVSLFTPKNKPILDFESREHYKGDNASAYLKFTKMAPYIAFSKSGTAEGNLIYANFGSGDNYRLLRSMGVKVNGSIALVRYGKISRSQKVVAAVKQGIIGLIIFSDPEDVNPFNKAFPKTWFLPGDAVQIGNINRNRGDPLSKGYPSLEHYYRDDHSGDYEKLFQDMIMIPISSDKAKEMMKHFQGKEVLPNSWSGKMKVKYRATLGGGRTVRISSELYFKDNYVNNVIATIVGDVEPDRYVIIGNHRDAWKFGATDPSSGTAGLFEVARVLGWLRSKGWRPRRTIILGSWDAEEMGLYGSTEWCEEFSQILTRQSVIYINVDTMVEGHYVPKLFASPHARDAFFDVIKRINFPKGHGSLYRYWVSKNEDPKYKGEPRVQLFSSGSDYMHFFASLGIPSMDFRFTFKEAMNNFRSFPVYHTIYDNFDWLEKFVDPDFTYHKVMADIWVQVTLLFADSIIIPFNIRRYGDTIIEDKEMVEGLMAKLPKERRINLDFFSESCLQFKNSTDKFHDFIKTTDVRDVIQTRQINDRLMYFERAFTTVEPTPEEGTSTRHVYQFNRLEKLLTDMRSRSNYKELGHDFKIKLTYYIHHLRMASQYLENHFAFL